MISDPFVRNVLSPILLFIFIILLAPTILTFIVVIKTDFFHSSETDFVLLIIDKFKNFKGLPHDIVSLIIQTLPALIGSICYRNNSSHNLNIVGYALFSILIIGSFFSFGLIWLLDPSDTTQAGALIAGKEGLQLLENGCETTFRTSITYLLLIIGLQIKTHNNSDYTE